MFRKYRNQKILPFANLFIKITYIYNTRTMKNALTSVLKCPIDKKPLPGYEGDCVAELVAPGSRTGT